MFVYVYVSHTHTHAHTFPLGQCGESSAVQNLRIPSSLHPESPVEPAEQLQGTSQ